MLAGLTGINHFFDIAHLIMTTEFVALTIFQRKYENEEFCKPELKKIKRTLCQTKNC
jgi:hypothetical protein